jgi:hypothetical protein
MTERRKTIVAGKQTVVRPPGGSWCFTLSEQDTIELTDDRRYVSLATPQASTLFAVTGIDDSDPEEIVVSLGDVHGRTGPPSFGDVVREPRGYPLPQVQDEFARLEARWQAAGGDPQRFSAWAQGADNEAQLRRIRAELRKPERSGE